MQDRSGASHSSWSSRRAKLSDFGGNAVRQSYLDERKTWFRPDFPLVAPGPINVYNPDHSANVRLLGRETDLCEFFASHLLTRGPVTTLVYGFGGYLLVVAVFTLLFVLGGRSCTNRPESFLSVEHVRVSFFLRHAPHACPIPVRGLFPGGGQLPGGWTFYCSRGHACENIE